MSFGEYFIVKEDPEVLEDAKWFLAKGSDVFQLLDLANCIAYSNRLGWLELEHCQA